MKQGGAISVGTGAVVEKGLGTAIGSYATTQGISGVAIGTVLYLLEILLLQLVVNLQRQPTSHKLLVMLLLRRVKVL